MCVKRRRLFENKQTQQESHSHKFFQVKHQTNIMSNTNTNTITVNIRMNSTVRFTLPSGCTLDTKLGQIKQMISEMQEDCAPARQRIIYRGRVLRNDEETLRSVGYEDNQTLHLVKGAAAPAPVAAPVPAAPVPAASPGSGSGLNMNNMMGMGMPNLSPEQMQQTMNNPMFQNMMDQMMQNPDMMNSLMQMNPQMQQMMDNNPQLRHALSDPSVMRQAMQAMRNPELMQQMMRQQDMAMSQIENIPGGFNHLRRMYEEVQEPMMEAMSSSSNTINESSNRSNVNSSGPTSEAMPNPWGDSSSSTANAPPANASTSNFPSVNTNNNAFGNTASNSGLANAFGNMNMPTQPPNVSVDQTIQMLENPAIRSMMDNVLSSNPEMLRNMMQSNPMFQEMLRSNPAAASMMSNPEMMRNFLNPDNLRAVQQMQQSMQQLQGNMNFGTGGVGNPSTAGSNPWAAPFVGAPAAGGLDFSALLNQGNISSTTTPGFSPAAQQPASVLYASQITAMEEMGFSDREANTRALEACGGNINSAVDWLLSRT